MDEGSPDEAAGEPVALTVNGRAVTVTADRDTPLIYVLRNDLGLSGVRFGCGLGQCGACKVLVDGAPRTSCDQPLWAFEGTRVETVETLREGDRLHPLAAAFLAEQAGQCGYCIPGILMSAKALIDTDPAPDRAAIAAALADHLCRCGSHQRILRAVERAARAPAAEAAR